MPTIIEPRTAGFSSGFMETPPWFVPSGTSSRASQELALNLHPFNTHGILVKILTFQKVSIFASLPLYTLVALSLTTYRAYCINPAPAAV
jgi:hypothetical protein